MEAFIMITRRRIENVWWLTRVLVVSTVFCLVGCEKRDEVFELESPAVDVQVEKSENGVDVDVNRTDERE